MRSPLELWNRSFYSYDTIPDDPYVSHHSRRSRLSIKILMVPILLVGLACLVAYAYLGSNYTIDLSHQETVVPTLLSVRHAQNQTLVYVLTNRLYQHFETAEKKQSHHYHHLGKDDASDENMELPELWLDKNRISPGESLVLTWTVGRNPQTGNILLKETDIIALYCPEDDIDSSSSSSSSGVPPPPDPASFLEAATIAQIRATSAYNGGSMDSWFIPSFPQLRRERCHFQLYSNLSPDDTNVAVWEQPEGRYQNVATSETLRISHAKETPTGIHLAITNDPTEMIIQFTTGYYLDDDAVPVVRIIEGSSSLLAGASVVIFNGTTDTYAASDLCQAPGNLTKAGYFYPPGMLHTVHVKDLLPDTKYVYDVGLRVKGKILRWSKQHIFRSALPAGDPKPFSYIVYADQGCPYHGWKGGKEWMDNMVQREAGGRLAAVHHFGDIAYSRGAAHVWDAWLDMIQPMATQVPLMVAVGNHEYDHTAGGGHGKDPSGVMTEHGFMPSWGNFGQDSGGECGVPTAKRFRMPNPTRLSNGVFWYSYDYGLVHTVVISSEHDLSQGSPQHTFLEDDLGTVNRTKTPWVILESHRPLYEGEGSGGWWPNNLVSRAMRDEFEDLLLVYNVDVVLAGHYHEYQRTCNGLYRSRCGQGGPMHITVGSAGAKLDAGFDLVNEWTERFIKGQFGYGRITIANSTALHFEFVLHGFSNEGDAGLVLDDLWIKR